ncbi:helix-turn-helix transcriptional regulator [Prescottella agglutinans]|uniref:LuxR family maltose regulon positive regulatory protein n=1 Tax=Prescottella agglutinans TaxID=1644129 RepID=A0ABT6MDM2_9NOCA|nr:LuxR family maltose regulon positive regulatory protein [Prescottella agglutinans]
MSITQDGSYAASADIPVFRSDRVVPRSRLLDALDAALTRPEESMSVVLVCAPAGSGKTTFLSDWAHRTRAKPERPVVAWTTINDSDDGPHRLHAELVRAFENTDHPEIRRICRDLPKPTAAQRLPIVRALLDLGEPVWLVLDDAHLLHDPDALADLEELLRIPSQHLRVIVCGRFEPPLAFQKLRLESRVMDVTFDDLAFTPEEASVMLDEHDVTLEQDDLSALMDRTEGWAAGIRLAGMSLAGHPDPTSLIENFTGCRRAVADYLIEQVLAGQSDEIRQFLIKTSVPSTFTAALAEELTGCADAHSIIDQLEHRNFLISRIENSPTQFRYHPLLRSYLRAEISRLGHRAVMELEHVTARWYAEFGDALLSLEHGITAGDVSDVESVLTESGLALVLDGHGEAVERLVADAPRPIRDRTIVGLVRAAAHLYSENPMPATSILGAVEPDDNDGTDIYATLFEQALRIQASIHTGDIADALERSPSADAASPVDPHLDSFVALQRGRGQLHLGHLSLAEEDLRRARAHAREVDSARIDAQASAALGAAALSRGALGEAQTLAAHSRAATMDADPHTSADTRRATLLEAMCHYLRNDTGRAVELATASVPGMHDTNAPMARESAVAAALFGVDLVDDRRAAVSALHTASVTGHAAPQPPGLLAAILPSIQFAYLHIGEVTWARELFGVASDTLGRTGDIALLEAILHLCANQLERARTLLRPVLDGELPCRAATNMVTAWLLEAEIARRRAHDARAHDALVEALRLAEPEGVLRPFHDMTQASRELLSASRGRFGARDSFADLVWASFPRTTVTTAEQLTRRELELLAELPTWRTAEEIASDLCVSVNTVKTHLRGIYRKLGVTTRRDAVAAAHDHGLL